MKLGSFLNKTKTSSDAQEFLAEEKSGAPSEFPDITTPETLTDKNIESTNESLLFNSELASNQLELLQSSLEVIKDEPVLSTPATHAVAAQLNTASSLFPEVGTHKLEAMNNSIVAKNPPRTAVTLEAMLSVMGKLRPLTMRALSVSANIARFLESGEELKRITEIMKNSQTLLVRGQRDTVHKEGQSEYNRFDHNAVFKSIIEAIDNGYEISEIYKTISANHKEAAALPETAVIAIAKGIEKFPLLKSREMSNTDIGSLLKFIAVAKSVQELTIEMLTPMSKVTSDLSTDTGLAMATSFLNSASGIFVDGVRKLGDRHEDTFSDKTTEHNSVTFQVYPDGRSIVIQASGQITIPQLAVERTHGYFSPQILQDSLGLCNDKVLPAIIELTERAKTIADMSAQVGKSVTGSIPDEMRMSDTPGVTFQASLNKFINVMKLSNMFVTIAIETSMRLCDGIIDLSRGTAVLIET